MFVICGDSDWLPETVSVGVSSSGQRICEPFFMVSKCDICLGWKDISDFEIHVPCRHGRCKDCFKDLVQANDCELCRISNWICDECYDTKKYDCQLCRQNIIQTFRLTSPSAISASYVISTRTQTQMWPQIYLDISSKQFNQKRGIQIFLNSTKLLTTLSS